MSTSKLPPFTPDRYPDEHARVAELVKQLPWDRGRADRIVQAARDLTNAAAARPQKMGAVEQFLQAYPLHTPEGRGLIGLAEALLRIPDNATADALIKDKVMGRAWRSAGGKTRDPLVLLSRLGLSAVRGTVSGFLAGASAPVIRRAFRLGVQMMGRQFVLGPDVARAHGRAGDVLARGYALSFDMLGEGARTMADADRYMNAYVQGIGAAAALRQAGALSSGRDGLSVKLSALHPRYHPLQADLCRPMLTERLLQLAQLARAHDLTLTVDAEETERLTLSLQIIADVAAHPTLSGWNGFGLAVQAYQKYAPELTAHVIGMARATGRVLRVRLVKGAYWDTEVKRAQVMGLPDYPMWTRKCNTDLSYLVCAHQLLAARDVIYPMFATHNAHTAAAILDLAAGRKDGFELQRLHGMGAALHDVLIERDGAASTIYAPIGTHEDLLAYLVRRLMENGANTSFINQTAAGAAAITDPVHAAMHHSTRRHAHIPLPCDLFGARKNSRGVDPAQDAERAAWMATVPGQNITVRSVRTTALSSVDQAVARARAAAPSWAVTPAETRAACLERFADLLESNTGALMHVLAEEGYKTIYDGIAEIREAVDFARYYAAQVREKFSPQGTVLPGPTGERNRLTLHGRGVFACISPWNFPLAIFAGQVTAALAAGNTVVAKPAEQTPRIAVMATEFLYRAGIPRDVLHLIIGDGAAGAHLTAHPDIAGVAFTGSTEVARLINRTLAARDGAIVPLIAETGGQNAMIVDATALPEQVVDDALLSAFGSAGQRCSALRVLYLQREIADRVIAMIQGAAAILRIGDPRVPSTDIGPVIDTAAHDRLVAHTAFLEKIGAKLLVRTPTAPDLNGHYFAPSVYEISSIRQLPDEVFGPILHIVRYDRADLPRVMADIASTGYGLTFGLHTRIDQKMLDLAAAAPAGNIYINRSQIGAVVESQPFGGLGLSGTGPKAGGPHYLLRFAHEKVVTQNTAASGGNLDLIASGD